MSKTTHDKFLRTFARADEQQAGAVLATILRERSLLSAILEALVDGLIVIRADFEIVLANAAAWRLLGLAQPSKVVGRRLKEFPLPADFARFLTRFVLGETSDSAFEMEIRGEEPRWLHVSLRHFQPPGEKDPPQLVMVVLRDVTALYRAEEQRRRAEHWKQMAILATGLAHEIKNPLNSLQIHAQLLQRALRQRSRRSRSQDTARQLQSCDIIVEEIARLGNVVNQFLAAVRPSRPFFQRANINYLIERVVETVRPEAQQRNVRLNLALDYEIPPVDFDPDQMRQVLLNLLRNAFEALDGVPEPAIEVRTAMDNGYYIIMIRDNGRGITPEDLERVREPFFTTKATGTGLGLAIVSRIVEEHGGHIDIQSDVRSGTAVTLRFPLVERPLRLLEDADAAAGKSHPPTSDVSPAPPPAQ